MRKDNWVLKVNLHDLTPEDTQKAANEIRNLILAHSLKAEGEWLRGHFLFEMEAIE